MTRNVFDQYKEPENRLTHALFASLARDQRLLRKFLIEVAGCPRPLPQNLEVKEQHLPGEPPTSEEDASKRGLPDAWIHGGNSWSVLVESKVSSPLRSEQLRRHVATAERRGFDVVRMLVITTQGAASPRGLPVSSRVTTWKSIYAWLRKQTRSEWAAHAAEYFEIAEVQMTADSYLREGTLTEFTGFSFGDQEEYGYLEAKRLLGLAIAELRRRRRLAQRVWADLSRPGRPAITGRQDDSVWNFIPLKGSSRESLFTKFPHLTLSVQRSRVLAHVTFPHGMRAEFRRNLKEAGQEGFLDALREVEKNLRPTVRRARHGAPWFVALQRHYKTQRSVGSVDARLEFDLRTVSRKRTRSPSTRVKPQDDWARAAFEVFARRRSNYQIAVGAIFPYREDSRIASREAIDLIEETWIACRPILKIAMGR